MAQLLSSGDLPPSFTYPADFVRVVELGLTNLEPWEILLGERLFERLQGMATRYPNRRYVPFARRGDNDDVAVWDLEDDPKRVRIVHDFASAGWEQHEQYAGFNEWLRQAIDDLIEFGTF